MAGSSPDQPSVAASGPPHVTLGVLADIAGAFLKLGLTSFGGPIAHLSYLRTEFVSKRRWVDDGHYADLVALCQFLPGPASSQVVFALGMQRAGLAGALLASCCFTLPSALAMIAFAYGVGALGDIHDAGWVHGLKLAAVPVVAQAVWGMGLRLCADRGRLTLCLSAAALLLVLPGAMPQVAVLAAGGLVGFMIYGREAPVPAKLSQLREPQSHFPAAGALALFALLLAGLPVASAQSSSQPLALFDSFYRAGALVFGGGHVVLPLLQAEVVAHGWVGADAFLAGYGAAQAVPGPLFTFAAYLGAAVHGVDVPWLNGLWCLFAIFCPAWLLIGGALPFWQALRSQVWAQGVLAGANATVVGVLLAALYRPVITESVAAPSDMALALCAYGLMEVWKAPPWVAVLFLAGAAELAAQA